MHYSCYKRPLLWLLIGYILLLALFYKPGPPARDVFHKISLQTVTLEGRVSGFPTAKNGDFNAVVKVSSVNGEKTDGYVYARFAGFTPQWRQTVRLSGTLKKPYSIHLPGNFDWGEYLALKGVFTEMKVQQAEVLSAPPWPVRALSAVRQDILNTFEAYFPRNLAAIAGGVLLGERGEIDTSLYSAFQDSGAIHLLVASGGNVGFVTLLVFAFCALFGAGRRTTAVTALAVAGAYTLIAGADAPLTRAYFMTVCAVAGYFLRRSSGVFQGLVISCLVILLFRPASLFETGFQMSFLATMAIVICLNNYTLPYSWPRWIKFFVQIFLATLSTQLALLPVFTNVFYKVSFVGLVSNMVLVPLASGVMGLSFAFYILTLLHIGFLLKYILWGALWTFEWLVAFFAAWPFASVPASAWRAGWIAAYYALIFWLFNLPQKTFFKKIALPVFIVVLLSPVVQYVFFNPPQAWLLNEWNKNAVFFRAPDGTRILIGAELSADKLARAVRASGSGTLDAVLITQDVAKQMKNVQELQKQIRVKRILRPFENTWPGDEINMGSVRVRTEWGVLLNREGKLWTNRGYSGSADSLSYMLNYKGADFTAAGNARFIVRGGEVLDNVRNGTRKIRL